MTSRESTRAGRPRLHLLLLAAMLHVSASADGVEDLVQGPESPPAARCDLEVVLEPDSGRIGGVAVLRLTGHEALLTADGRLPLSLHSDLNISSIEGDKGELSFDRIDDGDEETPVYALDLGTNGLDQRLRVAYEGVLRQDIAGGEKQGQIHNLQVRSHIGEEGVYLAPETAWHPTVASRYSALWKDKDPPSLLFSLRARSPFLLVATGDREEVGSEDSSWHTPFPVAGLALAGGPLSGTSRRVGEVLVRVHLAPSSADFAPDLLDAVEAYLELYQPLVGAYPYREFTIVENFFSSGFAYPGFTLLSSAVIRMGVRGLRPGYLDHEILHNWWGAGVLTSQNDGEWSEALTSYCTNYMRHVLEGRSEEARKQRRNIIEGLSRNPALGRTAVGDYGASEDVSRFIGYQKGSLVFSELADRIGQDILWRGLRLFFRERYGKPSTWEDLRRALETASDADLKGFFEYWVDGPGLPDPRVVEARYDDETRELRLRVQQSEAVALELPIRLHYSEESDEGETYTIALSDRDTSVRLAPPARPLHIEVDPDYQRLRLLPRKALTPTLSGIGPPQRLLIVKRPNDDRAYDTVSEVLRDRYSKKRQVRHKSRLKRRAVKKGHLLILGTSGLDVEAGSLFAAWDIEIREDAFRVGSETWDEADHALLACVPNPERSGAFACLYRGNGQQALERSHLLSFYGGSSLLIFDGGLPVERRDFERKESIEVL